MYNTVLNFIKVNGNAGKTPKHALTYNDILRVLVFIRNYAEVHGNSLAGRIPRDSPESRRL